MRSTISTALGLVMAMAMALPVARAASKNNREAAEVLLDEGSKDIKAGQFGEAVPPLQKCLTVDKSLGECPRALGIVYGKLGDEHKAAQYYRLYLRTTPTAKDAARVRELIAAYESSGG